MWWGASPSACGFVRGCHEGHLCRPRCAPFERGIRTGPGGIRANARLAAVCSARKILSVALARYLRRTCAGLDDRRGRGGGRPCVSRVRGSGWRVRVARAMRSAALSTKRAAATRQARQTLGSCCAGRLPARGATDPFTPRASHVLSPRLAGRSLATGARGAVAALTAPHRPRTSPV